MRSITVSSLVALSTALGSCSSMPHTLADIQRDRGGGDPKYHLENTFIGETIIDKTFRALASIFGGALLGDDDDDSDGLDVPTAAEIMAEDKSSEISDSLRETINFLSLSVTGEDLGYSKNHPACLDARMKRVATKLSTVVDRGVKTSVLECGWPNAFSMGRNQIGICRAFLMSLGTDDELAFVLAHEMSHGYLYHNDILVSAESRMRRQQMVLGLSEASVAVGATAVTYGAIDESLGALEVTLERAVGISEEEDDDNDIDTGVYALGAAASIGVAVLVTIPAAFAVSGEMLRSLVADVQGLKTRQELEADGVAVELMNAAGYDPEAAAFVLSRVFVEPTATVAGRAFTSAPTAALRRGANADIFSFSGIHPSVERRLTYIDAASSRRAVSAVSTADSDASGESINEVDGECDQEEVAQYREFVEGLSLMETSAGALLASSAPDAASYCADFGAFAAAQKGYSGDAELAVAAMQATFICGTLDYRQLIYGPYLSKDDISFDYLFKLAAFQAWLGDARGSYYLLDVLSGRAQKSIFAYKQIYPTLVAMGFRELASPIRQSCDAITTRFAVVGDVCDSAEHVARGDTVFGYGPSPKQITRLVSDSRVIGNQLSPVAGQVLRERRVELFRARDRAEQEDGREKFCGKEVYFGNGLSMKEGRIAIRPPDGPIIEWMNVTEGCLRLGPERKRSDVPLLKPSEILVGPSDLRTSPS